MKVQKTITLVIALILIGGAAGLLAHVRANKKLGPPGVKTSPIAGSIRVQVELPERVLDYDSELIPTDKQVLDFLPADTSFGQRRYKAADGFLVDVNVVLMGTDRTSLHKPEFCLAGQGWVIDQAASTETIIPIKQPVPYDLSVMKLVSTKQVTEGGRNITARGIYVYWFVADNDLTARHSQRMFLMAKDVLRTGVLQRWAYVTYFVRCLPGQEEATYERLKAMIAASVPEFQLTPRPPATAVSAR